MQKWLNAAVKFVSVERYFLATLFVVVGEALRLEIVWLAVFVYNLIKDSFVVFSHALLQDCGADEVTHSLSFGRPFIKADHSEIVGEALDTADSRKSDHQYAFTWDRIGVLASC